MCVWRVSILAHVCFFVMIESGRRDDNPPLLLFISMNKWFPLFNFEKLILKKIRRAAHTHTQSTPASIPICLLDLALFIQYLPLCNKY